MCKAMDDNNKKMRILGAIETYRDYGESDENIIKKMDQCKTLGGDW